MKGHDRPESVNWTSGIVDFSGEPLPVELRIRYKSH